MVLRWQPSIVAMAEAPSPCVRRAASIYLCSEVIWRYVMAKVLYLAVEKLRQYRLIASSYQEALLHLLCESATSNNTLERTVEHRGRIVLAMDCVLADPQWRWWPAAQLGR